MAGYIDLHLHFVPGVDDGVTSLQESVRLCRGLRLLGFERLVTTPHIRAGMFENRRAGLEQTFQRLLQGLASEGGLPQLELAAEHHCDATFLELFAAGELLPYPGGRAILMEFPNEAFPVGFEQLAFKLRLKGMAPVVAHPERYLPLFRRTDPIERLLDQDVLFQLDLMALVGKYGRVAQAAAERMLEEGVYAIAASDAHGPADLARVEKAIARLFALVGEEEANLLLSTNPQRLLEGRSVR
jgi:protein-tyrosine phosphatase